MSLFIHRMGLMAAGKPKPILSYRTHATASNDATTYTFSGIDFGAAAPDRHIIVGVGARSGSGNRSISSASIGGVAASVVTTSASGSTVAGILIAPMPSGVSGTVSVTMNAGVARAGIAVWSALKLSSATPVDAVAHATDLSVTTAADGLVVAVTMGAGTSQSWSGVTADLAPTVIESGYAIAAASATQVPAAMPWTVTLSNPGSNPMSAVASFR